MFFRFFSSFGRFSTSTCGWARLRQRGTRAVEGAPLVGRSVLLCQPTFFFWVKKCENLPHKEQGRLTPFDTPFWRNLFIFRATRVPPHFSGLERVLVLRPVCMVIFAWHEIYEKTNRTIHVPQLGHHNYPFHPLPSYHLIRYQLVRVVLRRKSRAWHACGSCVSISLRMMWSKHVDKHLFHIHLLDLPPARLCHMAPAAWYFLVSPFLSFFPVEPAGTLA